VAQPKSQSDEAATSSEWMRLTGLGVEFIVAVALPAAGGYGLDRWLETSPWLLLAGVGLGFALGLVLMVRAAKKMFR
jgi:F0F1-type ATP synthase assembly protein I